MSMLIFMPWCRIDKTYEIDCIKIVPFEQNKPINGLDDSAQRLVHKIMSTYKTIKGKPIDRAALVCLTNKSLIGDLSEEEIEIAYELAALSCFCGLAKREYFNMLGAYCNTDSFSLYIQKFDKAESTALRTRRRDGKTSSLWSISEIAITIPTHCHTIHQVSLDVALLDALAIYRTQSTRDEWVRWQNAISCFNQGSTDGENVRLQVEWVLLCSAFEHLLKAKSNAKDVADKFSKVVIPSEPLYVRDAKRRPSVWTDNEQPWRYKWIQEFYKIRGNFAHGKLDVEQLIEWNPAEHLLLATIVFPLLVKCLLKKDSRYELTNDDRVQIDCFEALADTRDFMNPPADQRGMLDSYWKRHCDNRKYVLAFERTR